MGGAISNHLHIKEDVVPSWGHSIHLLLWHGSRVGRQHAGTAPRRRPAQRPPEVQSLSAGNKGPEPMAWGRAHVIKSVTLQRPDNSERSKPRPRLFRAPRLPPRCGAQELAASAWTQRSLSRCSLVPGCHNIPYSRITGHFILKGSQTPG